MSMTHKHAPDLLLRHSGLQALKVILDKNDTPLPLSKRLMDKLKAINRWINPRCPKCGGKMSETMTLSGYLGCEKCGYIE